MITKALFKKILNIKVLNKITKHKMKIRRMKIYWKREMCVISHSPFHLFLLFKFKTGLKMIDKINCKMEANSYKMNTKNMY